MENTIIDQGRENPIIALEIMYIITFLLPPTSQLALLLELCEPRGLELCGALLARQTVNQNLETETMVREIMEDLWKLTSISFPVLAII